MVPAHVRQDSLGPEPEGIPYGCRSFQIRTRTRSPLQRILWCIGSQPRQANPWRGFSFEAIMKKPKPTKTMKPVKKGKPC